MSRVYMTFDLFILIFSDMCILNVYMGHSQVLCPDSLSVGLRTISLLCRGTLTVVIKSAPGDSRGLPRHRGVPNYVGGNEFPSTASKS